MHFYRIISAPLLVTAAFGAVTTVFSAPDDRFHGGAFDGAEAGFYNGYTRPSGGELGRFVGGGGFDGYASDRFEGYTRPSGGELGRFVGGGGFDGYGARSGFGFPNPLAGDSDGDGVPDWWESRNYLSLTRADAATDIDGDGNGSLFEWLADTDPNDPLSLLAILTFEHGDPVRVDFGTTSVNRRYWIEVSTDLSPGNWLPATSPPVIGEGGVMQLTTPDIWDRDAYFRIGVALPE